MSNDNYPTPRWLLNLFDNWYDPCPLNNPDNINGLETEWDSHTYVNPPYSSPSAWVDKAITESKLGKTIVMLLPVDTSTKWFAKLIEAKAHIFWHNGRLSFNGSPPRFASMLVVLNERKEEMMQ